MVTNRHGFRFAHIGMHWVRVIGLLASGAILGCGGAFASDQSTTETDGGGGSPGTGGANAGGSVSGSAGVNASGSSGVGGASGSGGAQEGGNECTPMPGCTSHTTCSDGCNTCSCTNGFWACTQRACPFDSGSGRVPKNHRAAGTTCPMTRGPGFVNPGCLPRDAGGMSFGCTSDVECQSGNNGRCYTNTGGIPCPGNACSYDACLGDGDCASNLPCECRSPESHNANVCAGGSNCRVDSDCGPGGYCSRSGVSNCSFGYFCHTAMDSCIDDADCRDAGSQSTCAFDAKMSRWRCRTDTCLPVP